ncbi:MAG: thiamine-phosphate kinase [Chitinophagales bacterium]
MDENTNRTEISELGEFKLITQLTKNFEIKNATTVKGIGDDAAVIDNGGKVTVVTTDMLVEGIHFDLMYTPLTHLGYKCVAVNVSDIYAMNATPHQITVSLAISNRFSVEALEELYDGIYHACEYYDVDLVGGDTTTSLKGMIISVTALGDANENDLVYRSGAKDGDLICVSGDLGAAYMGLQLLEREKRIYLENPEIKPDLENKKHIIGKFLKPEAAKGIINFFEENKIRPTSMIDISDGLSSEILHICEESVCGAIIYENELPIHPETIEQSLKFNLEPTVSALNGGEDYELLFTIDPGYSEILSLNPNISVIGKIVPKQNGTFLKTKNDNLFKITAQGWDGIKK